ncbi:MAG: methionyl-tRNA formyltransferase [Nitrospirae bacterium]|nr:methionyl-tRNA formyltransferase [Nitrospirota bacterium]
MAIIFFGTPLFAVPSLKRLLDSGEQAALVVTQPDRAKGRGHTLSPPPVKEFAATRGLKVAQPGKIRDETFLSELMRCKPEMIIVVAFGKILPMEILSLPRYGCINLHASLLPKYRGAAPIQWALINGEKKTGVTTMLMDSGMDTGDLLMKKELDISDDDNSETLSLKLAELGGDLLIETISGLRKGIISPYPQIGEASYAPILKKEDGRINWEMAADKLVNFVRGMNPWPSAFTYLDNERIKIIEARYIDGEGIPGRIEKASAGEVIVGSAHGLLSIVKLQVEGKRVMTAGDFLAGRRLRAGLDAFS